MIAVGKEDLALYALSSFIHMVSDLFLSLYLSCAAQFRQNRLPHEQKTVFYSIHIQTCHDAYCNN